MHIWRECFKDSRHRFPIRKNTERVRKGDNEIERERGRERQKERETDRQRERQIERDRQIERER
jgi:hypothetical protein